MTFSRRIFPFLLTMGLSAHIHGTEVQEMQMNDCIPEERRVHVSQLANGVKIYLQESQTPPQSVSFRVVFRTPSSEEVIYTFDGGMDSADSIGQFFEVCRERASGNFKRDLKALRGCHFCCTDLPMMHSERAQEIAVIAVGDFQVRTMSDLIDRNFGEIDVVRIDPDSRGPSGIRIDFDDAISKVAMRVSFPNHRTSIQTLQDLKDSWKYLLLQELLQQRMERSSRGLDQTWVHPHPHFFYPVKGYSFSNERNSENLLSFLLWQVEAIRNDGFSEEEFAITKRRLIDQLHYLSSKAGTPDAAFLASYYADQFMLGDRCLDVRDFFEASLRLVGEMQAHELLSCLSRFLMEMNRQIQIVYPMPDHAELLTRERIEQLIQRVSTLSSFYQNSGIQEEMIWWPEDQKMRQLPPVRKDAEEEDSLPILLASHHTYSDDDAQLRLADSAVADSLRTTGSPTDPFYQLPLTDKEQRFIRTIVTTMAEKNIIMLAFEKHSLEKKGKKVEHVHPMRFIGYILSDSELKGCMRVIRKSTFKWDAFVSGFSRRMKEEHHNHNLYPHVPGFAEQVNTTQDNVTRYIDTKDWEGLIKSLL